MTATPALTTDLKAQVKLLADDLRTRLEDDPARLADWQRIHREAVAKDRTAMTWVDWREDRIDQAAVAWILTTVFIRFCEDNSLLKPVWISGPKDRRQEALDANLAFFRISPEHGKYTDREWLESAVDYLRKLPATSSLVDAHSALEYISPSGDAVTKLLEFWRRRGDDGVIIHDLHDELQSTRFLGDLYQELSAHAQEKYALFQTPVFVEEFILDRTLEPALVERPLEGFRMIDPTCGSGHFLLGAFNRLLDRWHKHAPGMEVQSRVQTALDAIHGVDLNPFAVAIARFRLTVAALSACELRSIENAPAFKFHLVTGDSLVHGPDVDVIPGMEARGAFMPFHYTTEDGPLLMEILEEGRYDVVVGNPPYIAVRDKALNKIYRSKYADVCKGKYVLTVPFMKEFFALAKRDDMAGWVGQITSNSFMKREFGVPLIEAFLARRDLRLVVDASGAYIPNHGTPTVIIVGRNSMPIRSTVRAVLGIRGEPTQPEHADKGIVWSSIVDHVDSPDWNDRWITVSDLDRSRLAKHPWSLSGGGAIELLEAVEANSIPLHQKVDSIGITSFTLEDDVYVAARSAFATRGIDAQIREMVLGDSVRDWTSANHPFALFPYDADFKAIQVEAGTGLFKWMWPYRTSLSRNLLFGGQTKVQAGLLWTEYGRLTASKLRTPLSIAFAAVATHNHFALDLGGKVFKQSALVVKLPRNATEDDHVELLGILNSSTACFWLKQKSYAKTGTDNTSGGGNRWSPEPWYSFYDFNSTTLQDYPLPRGFPVESSRVLQALAQEIVTVDPSAVCSRAIPTASILLDARNGFEDIHMRMIAIQEELDWEVYHLYGLTDDATVYHDGEIPGISPGQRAFEIALEQDVQMGGQVTSWFVHHSYKPIVQIPQDWPTEYRYLTQKRLDLIASNSFIRLLEQPEYKRRWAQEPWEKRQERALRNWILDRLEDRRFWFDAQGRPIPRSVAQLGDEVTHDADIVSVLVLWEGRPDVSVTDSLKRLLADEAVPFHAGYRYRDSGLRKREAWENTWDKQRREDAGEDVDVQVSPKYTSADFQKASYWKVRGKLDVPKERFICYPDAARDADGTQLLGWAGWDHAEQALALASIIHDREQDGWPDERLVPLIAGLAELQPWVDQWHGEVHPVYGVPLAAFCAEELARRAAQVSMTIEQLRWWRPEKKKTKGRGKG